MQSVIASVKKIGVADVDLYRVGHWFRGFVTDGNNMRFDMIPENVTGELTSWKWADTACEQKFTELSRIVNADLWH